MCMLSGVSCVHLPSTFWKSFEETEITTISQMMWAVVISNSLATVKFATAKLKTETLPAGFPVAPCSTRHRSFLLLRIADLVVDVADVLDVSVSEIVAFPPSDVLHSKALYILGMIFPPHLVLSLYQMFPSFLNLRMNVQLNLRSILHTDLLWLRTY